MDEQKFRVRVRYGKTGRLRYLSHLETMRCLERSIRRARLPFLVTQGFSPHMRLSCGWALPVGVGSLDEYMDVFLGEYIPPEHVRAMLSESFPHDMPVFGVCYVDPACRSLEEEFPYSSYSCVFGASSGREEAGVGDAAGSERADVGAGAMSGRVEYAAGSECAAGGAGASEFHGPATGAACAVDRAGGVPAAIDVPQDADELLSRLQCSLDGLLERGSMVVHRKKKDKVVRFDELLVGTPELRIVDPDGNTAILGARLGLPVVSGPAVEMRMSTFTEGKGSLRPDLFCSEVLAGCEGIGALSITRTRQSHDRP